MFVFNLCPEIGQAITDNPQGYSIPHFTVFSVSLLLPQERVTSEKLPKHPKRAGLSERDEGAGTVERTLNRCHSQDPRGAARAQRGFELSPHMALYKGSS